MVFILSIKESKTNETIIFRQKLQYNLICNLRNENIYYASVYIEPRIYYNSNNQIV